MKNSLIIVWLCLLFVLSACGLPGLPGSDATVETIPPPATQTATATVLPPQASATATAEPTATLTQTPEPEVPLEDTPVPTPTLTATPRPAYVLQPGTPLNMPNFQDSGCSWMGVGGQIFGQDGQPVMSLVVELGGTLNGLAVSSIGLTGSTAVLGPGSYVIQLSGAPAASEGTIWVRVKGLNDVILSEKIYFTTFADCERNLVLINFSALADALTPKLFMPYIGDNAP